MVVREVKSFGCFMEVFSKLRTIVSLDVSGTVWEYLYTPLEKVRCT